MTVFNLVFEETPRKFLYQERKTGRGEGQHSKGTDQTERGRDESWEDAKQAALWPGPWNPPPQIDISIFSPLSHHGSAVLPSCMCRWWLLLSPCFSPSHLLHAPVHPHGCVMPGLPTVFPVLRQSVANPAGGWGLEGSDLCFLPCCCCASQTFSLHPLYRNKRKIHCLRPQERFSCE